MRRSSLLLSVVVLAPLASAQIAGRWFAKTPSSMPRARWQHAMCFDSKRALTIMVGPVGDPKTYAWDGTSWRVLSSVTPTGQAMSAAYDIKRDRVVVRTTDAIWEWNGSSWSSKGNHGLGNYVDLCYDPVRARVVSVTSRGVWEWSGTRFSLVAKSAPPSGKAFELAYDSTAKKLVANVWTPPWTGTQTLEWDGRAWKVAAAIGLWPGARLAYAPSTRGVIGIAPDIAQTFVLRAGRWQALRLRGTPGSQKGFDIAYDSRRNRTVYFGGVGVRSMHPQWELAWSVSGPPVVYTVDKRAQAKPFHVTRVRDAVDVAIDADRIEVRQGDYSQDPGGWKIREAIDLEIDVGSKLPVGSTYVVSDITFGERMVLSGLAGVDSLHVNNCRGSVLLRRCAIRTTSPDKGVAVSNSSDVRIVDCDIRQGVAPQPSNAAPGAVAMSDSRVAFDGGSVVGGASWAQGRQVIPPAAALWLRNSYVTVARCKLTGGSTIYSGKRGGDAVAGSGTLTTLAKSELRGGSGSTQGRAAGMPISATRDTVTSGGGSIQRIDDIPFFASPLEAKLGTSIPLAVQGSAKSVIAFFVAFEPTRVNIPQFEMPLLLSPTALLPVAVALSGTTLRVPLPNFAALQDKLSYWQGLGFTPKSAIQLSNARAVRLR